MMSKIFLLLSIVFVNGEEIKHFNLNMPMQTQQTCQEELDKINGLTFQFGKFRMSVNASCLEVT